MLFKNVIVSKSENSINLVDSCGFHSPENESKTAIKDTSEDHEGINQAVQFHLTSCEGVMKLRT